jgi:hypothetical protein
MRPNRLKTWRDWYHEFLRGSMFSLLPLPQTRAERELDAEHETPLPPDATRLRLNDEPRERPR